MPTEEQTYRQSVQDKLDAIHKQVLYTNGKVRKIIIALAIVAGIVIGQTFANPHDIITLLTSAL